MKGCFAVLLLSLPFVLKAQHKLLKEIDPLDDDTLPSKIWLGFEAGLEYGDRIWTTGDRLVDSRYNFTNVSERTPGVGYHAGPSAYVLLCHRLKLETGMQAVVNVYSVRKPAQISPFELNFQYKQIYLYIPLYFKYSFLEGKKYQVFISSGTGLMMLMANNDPNDNMEAGTNQVPAPPINYPLRYSPFALSWQAGIGAFYHVSSNVAIKLEPAFRGSLTSAVQRPDRCRLYSSTISLGVVYTGR
jgi:hypothetical protein